jgi:hypothetical protein
MAKYVEKQLWNAKIFKYTWISEGGHSAAVEAGSVRYPTTISV